MTQPYASPETVNVVVVHPQTLMRELLVRSLTASGLDVSAHTDVLDGPALARDGVDVVLVDERALHTSDDRIDIPAPLVLLMAEANDLTISRARNAGVAAFAMSTAPPLALADTLRRAAQRGRRSPTVRPTDPSRHPVSDRYE